MGERASIWGFGLCGVILDMTFVIMIAAARDIVGSSQLPTSAVLAVNILPLWTFKLIAPAFIDRIPYTFKVNAAALVGMFGLCATALLTDVRGKLLVGVASGAVATALGEMTFFALVSRYPKSCLVSLTTGTALCGFCGSGLYFLMIETLKLRMETSLLITSLLPLVMSFCYAKFLSPIPPLHEDADNADVLEPSIYDERSDLLLSSESVTSSQTGLSIAGKIAFIRDELLVKYMTPLFLIFMIGYLTCQGVVPVITFESSWVSSQGQYPLFLFAVSIGGILSRLSLLFFEVDYLYLLVVGLLGILGLLIIHAHKSFLPGLASFLVIALVEGALNGVIFVNAFRLMNSRIQKAQLREFAMGVVSVADATGVLIAAIIGLFLEPYLASLKN